MESSEESSVGVGVNGDRAKRSSSLTMTLKCHELKSNDRRNDDEDDDGSSSTDRFCIDDLEIKNALGQIKCHSFALTQN